MPAWLAADDQPLLDFFRASTPEPRRAEPKAAAGSIKQAIIRWLNEEL